jgi:uncharacterized membrane protein
MGEPAWDVIRAITLWALIVVFVGMGINHFRARPARTMAAMIPPFLRCSGALSPLNLVYFTGVCEIAGGVGLALPATRAAASVALVAFLVAVFPANAYAAQHPDRFGALAIPFWPRLAGQMALIALLAWVATPP